MRRILFEDDVVASSGRGDSREIRVQLVGPSDRDDSPEPFLLNIYPMDDDNELGEELRLPLAAIQDLIKRGETWGLLDNSSQDEK